MYSIVFFDGRMCSILHVCLFLTICYREEKKKFSDKKKWLKDVSSFEIMNGESSDILLPNF